MSLLHITLRIASSLEKNTLSKRIILHRLFPQKNAVLQNVRWARYIHNMRNTARNMEFRDRVYRRKDNLSDNYELIYYHPEQMSWRVFLFCTYVVNVVFFFGLIYFAYDFKPPENPRDVCIIIDRKIPMIKDRVDVFVPALSTMAIMVLVAMFLRRAVARMYIHRETGEYLLIYIPDLNKEPRVTIPFNCFKPKFPMPLLAGREVIYTANEHTAVLFEENFTTPFIARKVLTNCMENF